MSSFNIPDFAQIPPKVNTRGVLAQLGEVPAKEHLAPLNLGCLLIQPLLVGLGLDGG